MSAQGSVVHLVPSRGGTTEPFAMVPMDLITNPQIHASAVRVYARLAASVNAQDSTAAAWPSTRSLAVELGMARRTVQQAIEDLQDHGWLTEIPKDEWLPRWKAALDDRLMPVRVYGLPRHPKKATRQSSGRKTTRKEKAAEETRTRVTNERERFRSGLMEFLETGVLPDRIKGRNATLDMEIHMGRITDEASVQRFLDKHWKVRDEAS